MESASTVIKVFRGEDVRRIRTTLPSDTTEWFPAVRAAVQEALGLKQDSIFIMKYKDTEGDLCTLTEITAPDFMELSQSGALKVFVEPFPSASVADAETSASMEPNLPSSSDVVEDAETPSTSQPNQPSSPFVLEDVETPSNLEPNLPSSPVVEGDAETSYNSEPNLLSTPASATRPNSIFQNIDMDRRPKHIGEGLLQGLHKLRDHVDDGAETMRRKSEEGRQHGVLGIAKGVGEGLPSLGLGVWKGVFDLRASAFEGWRTTPDALADKVNKDRNHSRHGVDSEGPGELLQSHLSEEEAGEPANLCQGIRRGATGLGRGISGGLKALEEKSRDGYSNGGQAGLVKGLGLGAIGFGSNVASGVLDLAVNVNLGLKNTPEAIGRFATENSATSQLQEQEQAENAEQTASEHVEQSCVLAEQPGEHTEHPGQSTSGSDNREAVIVES